MSVPFVDFRLPVSLLFVGFRYDQECILFTNFFDGAMQLPPESKGDV
jgi:hypothetical protein